MLSTEIKNQWVAKLDEANALVNDTVLPVEERSAKIETLMTEATELETRYNTQVENEKKLADANAKAAQVRTQTPIGGFVTPTITRNDSGIDGIKIPATAKRYGKTKNMGEKEAYINGQWYLAVTRNDENAETWLRENGIYDTRDMSTANANNGGAFIPDVLVSTYIDLKEQYGVLRANMNVLPLNTYGSTSLPRRTAGTTAYWIGQNAAPTESNPTSNTVTVVPRDLGALVEIPNQLMDSAILSIGDIVGGEIAYSLTKMEDDAGFIGDGTSTYGGITGVAQRLENVFTTSGGTGLIVAAGNLMTEVTRANLHSVKAALPAYAAKSKGCKWYMSSVFWANAVEQLAFAVGGATVSEFQTGMTPSLLGYPVELVQSLPITDANSQVLCVFGDLNMAGKFAEFGNMSISTSREGTYFTQRQTGILGAESIDINFHDVGATGTAGPVVGLISASA